MNKNVFGGPNSIRDFLSPENIAPLVQLTPDLNHFHADGVEIWAKVYDAYHIKFVTVIGMLEAARKTGKLMGVHTLVEASSGNTVAALKIVARWYGIDNVIPVIPRDIAPGKLEIIRLLGMDPVFHSGDGIAVAAKLGAQKGFLNLNQYADPANPAAHEKWTGPQILEQTDHRIRIMALSLGTTGTLIGLDNCFGKYYAGVSKNVTMVGVMCDERSAIPGVRTRKGLEQISLEWEERCDSQQEVSTEEAYGTSLAMVRKGIMAGPSSGLALSGLYKFLDGEKKEGRIDSYRGSDSKIVAVFICPDIPNNYWEKYSMALSAEALNNKN